MTNQYISEPMLEMYLFETSQLLEQLETLILESEKSKHYSPSVINEIFRIMHTIKGSSAMMLINNITSIAHILEDLFYFIREGKPENYACSDLSDLVLEGIDFIKVELAKVKAGDRADGDDSVLKENINGYLCLLKQGNTLALQTEIKAKPSDEISLHYYIDREKTPILSGGKTFKAIVHFEEGCEMENIRAFTIIHNLKGITEEYKYFPEDIVENEDSIAVIREQGFTILFKTNKSYEEMYDYFMKILFLDTLELTELTEDEEFSLLNRIERTEIEVAPVRILDPTGNEEKEHQDKKMQSTASQGVISVNLTKLNMLMDLVGEMVVAETMVTQNQDLKGLVLDNFQKAARQLNKITGELQDMVMAIRMVPISSTFQKMHRVVRDMSKKLGKDIELEIIGEETEVDKNIIEHISDPLMHLVRNAIDHGIEPLEERMAKGKPKGGRVTLEAGNAGSDVIIIVKDDGRGLNKEKILKRAGENGLLHKNEMEMTDREIYSLIFLPGFSTKDSVTEFSGRGVGMDVVTKNIEAVGGTVVVDSIQNHGSTITIKIPLTLAIINGMNIRVGASHYTIPITSIVESFRPKATDVIMDPNGNEMIMVRGQCYPILRMHELYKVIPKVQQIHEGIIIMVESGNGTVCIFADELIGEQQVVVKALPRYIKKVKGLSGCALLGDGSISLIIDVASLMND